MGTQATTHQKLSSAQRKTIEALVTCGNVSEAARIAGVNRATVYKWLAQPAFSSELREAEAVALQSLTRSLMALGDKATAALEAVFDDPSASHAVKIKAAGVVFRSHPQYLHATDVVERLAALEELESEREG